jgi:Tfp pilus assembly protein PilF/uncharacterized RDD family membrane protein YckC
MNPESPGTHEEPRKAKEPGNALVPQSAQQRPEAPASRTIDGKAPQARSRNHRASGAKSAWSWFKRVPTHHKIIWAGVAGMGLLTCYVPVYNTNAYWTDGYHCIFARTGGRVDLVRVILPMIFVVAATAAGVYLTRDRDRLRGRFDDRESGVHNVEPRSVEGAAPAPTGAEQDEAADGAPKAPPMPDTSKCVLAGPMRRFFARTFDLMWETLLVSFLLGLLLGVCSPAFAEWIVSSWAVLFFNFLCLPAGLVLDASVYSLIGSTPGKALLGLEVTTLDGSRLSFARYAVRNLWMWVGGLCLGIPLLSLITMIGEAQRLGGGHPASYDEYPAFRVWGKRLSLGRKLAFGIVLVALLGLRVRIQQLDEASRWTHTLARLEPGGIGPSASTSQVREPFVSVSPRSVENPPDVPTDPDVSSTPKNAVFYLNRARTRLRAREYDKAIEDATEAIRRAPTVVRGYCDRGYAWAMKGNFGAAIADYDEAIRIAPQSTEAHDGRGNVRRVLKDYDAALADYETVVQLNPLSARAYYKRGRVLTLRKEFERAVRDYEKAVELDPKLIAAHNSLAWVLATCPDAKVRDGRRAIGAGAKACQLTDWKSGLQLDTLAAAYAEAGQFAEAIHYQARALEDPQVPPERKDELRMHMELYRRGEPCRWSP